MADRIAGALVLVDAKQSSVPPSSGRPGANRDAQAILELQELLRRAFHQVLQVEELRCRMPTMPPRSFDPEGVAIAEIGLRSLRRSW